MTLRNKGIARSIKESTPKRAGFRSGVNGNPQCEMGVRIATTRTLLKIEANDIHKCKACSVIAVQSVLGHSAVDCKSVPRGRCIPPQFLFGKIAFPKASTSNVLKNCPWLLECGTVLSETESPSKVTSIGPVLCIKNIQFKTGKRMGMSSSNATQVPCSF